MRDNISSSTYASRRLALTQRPYVRLLHRASSPRGALDARVHRPLPPTPSFPRRSYSSSNRALKSIVASVDASSGGVAEDDGAHPLDLERWTAAVDPTSCASSTTNASRDAPIRVDESRVGSYKIHVVITTSRASSREHRDAYAFVRR